MQRFYIENLQQMPEIAKLLLERYQDRKVFAFSGELGTGKTTFIKEICRQLHVTDTVSSPTFSLINEYKNDKGNSLFHMDFYRINSIREAMDIGIEEYFFTNNYCFIEWPEIVNNILPEKTVYVKITGDDQSGRTLSIYSS